MHCKSRFRRFKSTGNCQTFLCHNFLLNFIGNIILNLIVLFFTLQVIVDEDLGWPNALTVSFETKELFYGDAKLDYIGVCDFNGQNRKRLFGRDENPALKLHHIFAMAVWEDRVFWSDWETKSIESCHKDHGNNCSTLLTTIHRPMDIRVYHSYRQRSVEVNPCAAANCDTICLLSPEPPYYKCECPDKYYLHTDNHTCIANCTSAEFECTPIKKCVPFYWICDTQVNKSTAIFVHKLLC